MSAGAPAAPANARRLARAYGAFTLAFVLLVAVLGGLEQAGLPRAAIGYAVLAATFALYAGIGLRSRTNDPAEHYVAGRAGCRHCSTAWPARPTG